MKSKKKYCIITFSTTLFKYICKCIFRCRVCSEVSIFKEVFLKWVEIGQGLAGERDLSYQRGIGEGILLEPMSRMWEQRW